MLNFEDEEENQYGYQVALSHALPDRLIITMENVAFQKGKEGSMSTDHGASS